MEEQRRKEEAEGGGSGGEEHGISGGEMGDGSLPSDQPISLMTVKEEQSLQMSMEANKECKLSITMSV